MLTIKSTTDSHEKPTTGLVIKNQIRLSWANIAARYIAVMLTVAGEQTFSAYTGNIAVARSNTSNHFTVTCTFYIENISYCGVKPLL